MKCLGVPDCATLWENEEAARTYWKNLNREGMEGRIQQILSDLPVIQVDWRILDIGSGPGNLTIPLAKKAKEVVAVEPALGMQRVLKESMEHCRIHNIRILPYRWEETPSELLEGTFDLIVSVFSLGMDDLLESVTKMIQVAKGWVYIYWFAGESSWQRTKRELWPQLHGEIFPESGTEDIVYNLLYSLHLPIEVKRHFYTTTVQFSTEGEVIEYFRRSYRLDTRKLEQQFIQLFLPTMTRENGMFLCEERAEFAAYFWNQKYSRR